jgi:hypothetical protein
MKKRIRFALAANAANQWQVSGWYQGFERSDADLLAYARTTIPNAVACILEAEYEEPEPVVMPMLVARMVDPNGKDGVE